MDYKKYYKRIMAKTCFGYVVISNGCNRLQLVWGGYGLAILDNKSNRHDFVTLHHGKWSVEHGLFTLPKYIKSELDRLANTFGTSLELGQFIDENVN